MAKQQANKGFNPDDHVEVGKIYRHKTFFEKVGEAVMAIGVLAVICVILYAFFG